MQALAHEKFVFPVGISEFHSELQLNDFAYVFVVRFFSVNFICHDTNERH